MRVGFILIAACLILPGCKHAPEPKGQKAATHTPSTSRKSSKQIITPVSVPVGTVALVNSKLRFVVLDFGLTKLPQMEQRLNVYHAGQKVGELKVTGPSRGNNITADLLTGDAAVGDEVREN